MLLRRESQLTPFFIIATIKWVKGELIGKGTFGKVFLALNVTTSEFIAVKQVEVPQTPTYEDDVRQVSIFNALKVEQQILETLDHPNIVQYLGFEQTREFFSV
jgi:serine/threonine protein kinase